MLDVPIILSGSAVFFAAGMIAKILWSESPEDADCVLLHGGGGGGGGGGAGEGGGRVAALLRRGRASVDACLDAIDDGELAAALAERRRGGLRVRVIVHGDGGAGGGSGVRALLASGVDVRARSARGGERLRHSFVVVDAGEAAATLLAGALGAPAADGAPYDNTLITTTPRVTDTFAMEFERLWAKF